MKILYTGASKFSEEQKDPSKSLGGYVSSSVIPNDYLQSVFPATSQLAIQQKKKATRLISILNDTLNQASDLSFVFKLDEKTICKYKVAVVAASIDACDHAVFERIDNGESLPYYAEFTNIQTNTPLSIGNLDAGKYLGIWLVREYDAEKTQTLSCPTYQEKFDAGELSNEENSVESFEMKISWNEEQSISNSQSQSISNSFV